jgi:hypothetical protein
MWILPRQLHTSAFVPDTEALISDSTEQSQICAQSLLARSKPSPARTWSQRWKRDSWTQHLSGRILKPSHGPSFVTAWTSSLAATRASHSAQPASASEPKTPDTSGRLSQPELLQCDLVPAFLKTSTDISRWGFPTFCKTWQDWVTEQRGAWRQRVNAARLTRGSGSLSWPTIRASEYKDVGPVGSKSHDHMLGKHYLCAVVTQEEASWPTPCAMEAEKAGLFNKGQMGQSLSAMANRGELHGQAAPANPSTLGSRQGLSEQSQRNWQTFAPGTNNRGMTPHRQVVKALVRGSKAKTQMLTVDQVFAEEIKKQELWLTPRANEPDSDPNFAARNADRGAHCHGTLSSQAKELWPTITAHTPDMESNGPNGHSGTYLAGAVKQWGSPAANDANKTPHCEVNSNQAGLAKSVGLELQRQWATPCSQEYSEVVGMRPSRAATGRTTEYLHRQINTQTGKLNPRWVETLMGLPIGWTMPSCIRPVTIELTSCDSLGTALCQPSQSERSDFLLAS